MITSHVIEFQETQQRRVVLNLRSGSFSLSLDEVKEVLDSLSCSICRALDPRELPSAPVLLQGIGVKKSTFPVNPQPKEQSKITSLDLMEF